MVCRRGCGRGSSPGLRTSTLGSSSNEVTHAISSRFPTGDDLALVDRAVRDCEPSSYTLPWNEALGEAPNITQVGNALREYDIPSEWSRSAEWALLLPPHVAGGWASPSSASLTSTG